ncbi:enhanced serine sensitivity protein SseB C-terminal domain-containing protein [Paludibacterium sp. B53371]|uniref:enhanced serine sensitivity protein SseB C-terminal domain-containing protein n=1 Tax=Paludibacterium sp. B53371 TaxID=2806263 RepID=UPI001C05AB83|nr:enhanced serine sensitivity protein SseB C-terminal domain-containing protein [Paludibacterium sp. B53371]
MEVIRESPLEALLRQAAADPAHRPAFFAALLQAEVFIIGHTDLGPGETTIQAGSQLHIQHWQRPDGVSTIPFFTSLGLLQQAIEQESRYLALPARSLFVLTLGSALDLNPGSDCGKSFEAAEIRELLASGLTHAPEQREIREQTSVLLGQPLHDPQDLKQALSTLLLKHPPVQRAYLALMHDTSQSEQPHLVIGLEGEGDIEQVLREAGNVLADLLPAGEVADLLQIHANEGGLADYFHQSVVPFYQRGPWARFKAWWH